MFLHFLWYILYSKSQYIYAIDISITLKFSRWEDIKHLKQCQLLEYLMNFHPAKLQEGTERMCIVFDNYEDHTIANSLM